METFWLVYDGCIHALGTLTLCGGILTAGVVITLHINNLSIRLEKKENHCGCCHNDENYQQMKEKTDG